MKEKLTLLLQFSVSVLVGCAVFGVFYTDPNPKIKYIAGFGAGILAAYGITYLANGIRYGFKRLKIHF